MTTEVCQDTLKGLTSAAGQKANGEKAKLACDMGGGGGEDGA